MKTRAPADSVIKQALRIVVDIIFPGDRDRSGLGSGLRLLFWLALCAYSYPFLAHPLQNLGFESSFLHMVNLVFHEAGHAIFMLFTNNKLAVAAAGSFMQCLVPLVLAAVFYGKNRDAFAAGLCLWWFGQNLVDCAPYIGDARYLQLTLLGGRTGREVEGHDWEYILTALNVLNKDILFAKRALLWGRLVMLASLAWALAAILADWLGARKKAGRSAAARAPAGMRVGAADGKDEHEVQ